MKSLVAFVALVACATSLAQGQGPIFGETKPSVRVSASPTYTWAHLGGRRVRSSGFEFGAEAGKLRGWLAFENLGARGLERRDGTANRFDSRNTRFGVTYTDGERWSATLALERPSTGRADSEQGTRATYAAPRVDAFSVAAPVPMAGFWGEAGYARVSAAAGDSHVVRLGLRRTMAVAPQFEVRGRVGASFEGGDVERRTRGSMGLALAYSPRSWLTLEYRVDAYLGGLPSAGSDLTGITSFLVYRPNNSVENLGRTNLVVSGLRLTAHLSF